MAVTAWLGSRPPCFPSHRPGPHPSPPGSDTGAAPGCTRPGVCRRSGSRRACSHTPRSGNWIRLSTRPRLRDGKARVVGTGRESGGWACLPAAFPRHGLATLTHALQQVPVVVEALLAIALVARLCIHALALLADLRPEQYALVDVCGGTSRGCPVSSTCEATRAHSLGGAGGACRRSAAHWSERLFRTPVLER